MDVRCQSCFIYIFLFIYLSISLFMYVFGFKLCYNFFRVHEGF